MKQSVAFRNLGRFDVSAIQRQLHSEPDESWSKSIAKKKGNEVHRDAKHISLINDMDGRHYRGSIYPKFVEYEPLVMPVLKHAHRQLGEHTWLVRLQFAWTGPSYSIFPHRDTATTLLHAHRVHVPIASNPSVEFICGDESLVMGEGEIWCFDNSRTHAVHNRGTTPRIHMIADFAEPLPISAWPRYLQDRLRRVCNGNYFYNRRLVRKHGARPGRVSL